jgi:hypothetical protein
MKKICRFDVGVANMTESEKLGSTLGNKSLGPQNKKIFSIIFYAVCRTIHFSCHFDNAEVKVISTDITLSPPGTLLPLLG